MGRPGLVVCGNGGGGGLLHWSLVAADGESAAVVGGD